MADAPPSGKTPARTGGINATIHRVEIILKRLEPMPLFMRLCKVMRAVIAHARAETARADAAERERDRAEDEAAELRDVPWPAWADACLKLVRDCNGQVDDEADLPEELEELLSKWDDFEGKYRAEQARVTALTAELEAARKREEAALKERDAAQAALQARFALLDGCPFSRPDCQLEPEQPCPICGDLGTWDDENTERPSKCISNRRLVAAHDTQAQTTTGGDRGG